MGFYIMNERKTEELFRNLLRESRNTKEFDVIVEEQKSDSQINKKGSIFEPLQCI